MAASQMLQIVFACSFFHMSFAMTFLRSSTPSSTRMPCRTCTLLMLGTQDEEIIATSTRSSPTVTMVDDSAIAESDIAVVVDGQIGDVSTRHIEMMERLSTADDDDYAEGEFEAQLEELLQAGLLGSDAGWL